MTHEELASFIKELGQPAYRAKQIREWLLRGVGFDGMTNLSKSLREQLIETADDGLPRIDKKLVSSDGTIKYLFELSDGQKIESVVMDYEHGATICVSSQAGCRMGCKFCASNTGGLVRSLKTSEMLGQVLVAQRDSGKRIGGIVLMGIGEPLDNYDNVIKFIRMASSPDFLNIGQRHISLSTCGVVPGIKKLMEEDLQITLSISLHATNDDERDLIMPVNRKWGLGELLPVCREYFDTTGRRISFEYTLIEGVNDDDRHADALAVLLQKHFGREVPFHVNLIPVNEVAGRGFSRSKSAERFMRRLNTRHVNATIRRSLGGDINASCGQLRNSK